MRDLTAKPGEYGISMVFPITLLPDIRELTFSSGCVPGNILFQKILIGSVTRAGIFCEQSTSVWRIMGRQKFLKKSEINTWGKRACYEVGSMRIKYQNM